mgnify:CR=1 FL=1
MDYDNTNTGILSRNERRENDRHPEFSGSINVGGVEYWLSAWVKTKKDGSGKFFSLSVKPKDSKPKAAPKPAEDIDEEIPF